MDVWNYILRYRNTLKSVFETWVVHIPFKHNYNICSMHLNIRSLPDKFDKLKLLLTQLDNININIDFILICETYLTDRNHDLYHLPVII